LPISRVGEKWFYGDRLYDTLNKIVEANEKMARKLLSNYKNVSE
jgi:hypothetical protein